MKFLLVPIEDDEVKLVWQVNRPTPEMQVKASAVLASGQTFAYLTDKNVR